MRHELYDEFSGDVAVERSLHLDAPADTVWAHISDGELLGEWMGGSVEIDVRVGGRIEMESEGAPPVWGVVEEVVPGERLQWCWRTDDGLPTLVEIDIEPRDEGTTLTVRETLLPWEVTEHPPRWGTPQARWRLGLSAVA